MKGFRNSSEGTFLFLVQYLRDFRPILYCISTQHFIPEISGATKVFFTGIYIPKIVEDVYTPEV